MDIISLPAEYDHKKIDGKFRLVAIAGQRAKELSLGAKPKIATKSRKVTTIAVEEAIENKLDFVIGDEAVIAREKAGTFDYRKQLEESKKIAAGEDLTELEKDLKVYLHEKGAYDKKAFEELFTDKKGEDTEEAEE
jgi:DNA-directed RNA polymerase subunit omega